MKVNWQSQEVSISNNYAAVARNCLGSSRPSVLRSCHLPQDHVNPVGCSFTLMGDYSRVHSKAHYWGLNQSRIGELRVTGCLVVTEAATRIRADVSTHSRRAFTSSAQFGKSFQGGGANVWRSLSIALLTLAIVGCTTGEG